MGEQKHNPSGYSHSPSPGRSGGTYGCNEYRQEMILAGLQRSLNNPNLQEQEKEAIREQIRLLEESMGL